MTNQKKSLDGIGKVGESELIWGLNLWNRGLLGPIPDAGQTGAMQDKAPTLTQGPLFQTSVGEDNTWTTKTVGLAKDSFSK